MGACSCSCWWTGARPFLAGGSRAEGAAGCSSIAARVKTDPMRPTRTAAAYATTATAPGWTRALMLPGGPSSPIPWCVGSLYALVCCVVWLAVCTGVLTPK